MEHPQEIVAREKLVKALFITGNMEESEQEAQDLLQLNEKDEMAIWYMSKINRKRNDLYGERQYLEKLIEVSPPISQIKAQQRLEKVKSLIDEEEMKAELEKAKQESYTEETRKEFLQEVEKGFVEGTLTLENMNQTIEEAKKYPNFMQSLISIFDIKAKMTGNLQDKINGLKEYLDTAQTLTPEQYSRLSNEIVQTREQEKKENEVERVINRKYEKEKYEDSNEQRQYSKQVIQKLNRGEITREELPLITAKLESFKDRAKSIFLITKLNEAICGREEAYNTLLKYSSISDLTEFEKQNIGEMQRILTRQEKTIDIKQKGKKIRLKEPEKKVYDKKIQKQEIINLLNQRKTVLQIHEILKEKGTSLKSIARVKTFYLRQNEELRAEQLKLETYAGDFIKEGYSLKDVYAMMEYDIPMTKLKTMEEKIKKSQLGDEERK